MRARSRKKSSNPRITKKERNLLKGAIRRVFSRSELRHQVILESIIPNHTNPSRPRVTKWSTCAGCSRPTPTYLVQVDHVLPVVPTDSDLEHMRWDEVVDRVWTGRENLQVLCDACHKTKTKSEAKMRREHKSRKLVKP